MTVVEIVAEVAAALRSCNIPFVIGGSFASSAWGHPRQTNDVDIEVLINLESWACLKSHLGGDYLVNESEFMESINSDETYRTAQLINIEEAFKIDLFLLRDDAYTKSEMARVKVVPLAENVKLPVLAPENIVLHKLRWFASGGEVSDRQWSDIVQILETQSGRLDTIYLEHWSLHFSVHELLQRALEESGA